MAYQSALQSLASKGNSQPASLGIGTPPDMPGLPPPPTNMGPMPTGDPSTTAKAAADQAILALREAKGHFPSLGQQLDSTIDGLKNAAKSKAPPPQVGQPSAPGSAAVDTDPVEESGSPGPF